MFLKDPDRERKVYLFRITIKNWIAITILFSLVGVLFGVIAGLLGVIAGLLFGDMLFLVLLGGLSGVLAGLARDIILN